MTEEPGDNSPGLFKCPAASSSSSSATSAGNSRRSRGGQLLLLRLCLAEAPPQAPPLLVPPEGLLGSRVDGTTPSRRLKFSSMLYPIAPYPTGPSVLSSLPVQFLAWHPLSRKWHCHRPIGLARNPEASWTSPPSGTKSKGRQ